MSREYSREILRVVVAQICQTVGWHSIMSTPLEFLVDLLADYLFKMYNLSHQYAELCGRTEANLNDVGLTFQYLDIDIQQLSEYVRNVDSVPCVIKVPKYPIRRENHLNFLKPGSREALTRPAHIHEYLPPMYPEAEDAPMATVDAPDKEGDLAPEQVLAAEPLSIGQSATSAVLHPADNNQSPERALFKRPCDPLSESSPIVKRSKMDSNESRPLREIHSVMMTTSGFLSPAREGKLPESRSPIQARPDSPSPISYPMVPPEIIKSDKKVKKVVKKTNNNNNNNNNTSNSNSTNNSNNNSNGHNNNNTNNNSHNNNISNNSAIDDKKIDKENKRNKYKEKDVLFKADKITEVKGRKTANTKETNKPAKSLKSAGGGKGYSPPSASPTPPSAISHKDDSTMKPSKNIPPKVKASDKVIMTSAPVEKRGEDVCDKLPSEPDKQKLNILKKISKSRDEGKTVDIVDHHKYKDMESHENSPGLIIDEPHQQNKRTDFDNKKILPHTPPPPAPPVVSAGHIHNRGENHNGLLDLRSPSSDVYMFDDMSLPGTPSTPKTPELHVPSSGPSSGENKSHNNNRKRKDKTSKRKSDGVKSFGFRDTLKHKMMNDMMDGGSEVALGRPKTPEALETSKERNMGGGANFPLPYFPAVFPSTPGLIPTGPGLIPSGPGLIPPLFPRFPLPLGRGVQPPPILPPTIGGGGGGCGQQPTRPTFLPMAMKIDEFPSSKHINSADREHKSPVLDHLVKNDLEKTDRTCKSSKEKMNSLPTVNPPPRFDSFLPSGAAAVPDHQSPEQASEKLDKVDKKIKKHKVDKKDKIKKKKDKKEKHKEKQDKIKESKKEKLEKLKDKRERRERRKEKEDKDKGSGESVPKITFKLGTSSPRPATPDNPLLKKITIKPLIKKPEDIVKREASPELAKISALVTRPPKPKIPKVKEKKEEIVKDHHHHHHQTGTVFGEKPPVTIVDNAGHQVWICPACGNQDDGSPMIGCDDCDAWYHWVCVGMQVPPADDENWYCRTCITKQQELRHDKKQKKKRKKKTNIAI